MMVWWIDDFDQYQLKISNWYTTYYVPKFRIKLVIEEPYLYIYFNDRERGDGGDVRVLKIDYRDVADGYGGYLSNPSSAAQLAETIEAYIISGWTNIVPGLTSVSVDGVTITGDGTPGDPLVSHAAGGANLWAYIAKTTITTGDPTTGHLIWDNAAQASATQINLSHITDDGFDIDLYFPYIITGDQLVVQDRNDSTNYQIWTVSGTPTIIPNSYIEIPVTLNSSGGTGTTNFPNNHDLLVAKFSVSGSTLPPDGDYGDITVSASGATWTIDNDVVTFAKMQNIATDRVLGRDTAGSGDIEELSLNGLSIDSGALVNKSSYIIASTGTVASTNTTAEEALWNVLIPGGTLGVNDWIEVKLMNRKTSGVATNTFRVRLNTATGVGGSIISNYAGTSTQTSVQGPLVSITGASAQISTPAFNGTTYAVAAVDTVATAFAIASDIYLNFTNQKVTGTDGFELRTATVIIHKYRT